MKKTLRISLVALFAAVPMMAMAATGDPVAGAPVAQGTQTDANVTTTVKPKFAVATEAATDTNAASAGYVKGAYNAAIRAINTVYDEVHLTEGEGIDITSGVISVEGGGITAAKLASSAVETAKIKDSAVTTDKINSKAVTAEKIADNTITATQIATSGVGSDEIAANAVTSAKIADSAVLLGKIDSTAKINATDTAAYSGTKLTTQGYVDEKLAGKQATISDLEDIRSGAALGATALQANSALNGANLTSGTVAAAALASSAVTTDKINSKAVTAEKIADNTITATQIATSGVGSDEIAANAVTSAKIADSAVLLDKIDSTAKINATNTATYSGTKLTTQGYVDEKVAGAVTTAQLGMATQSGVVATIKGTTLTQGDVTQGVTGNISGTTSTIASIMTKWGDDATKTDVQAITAVSNGTLTTNVSVAAPTITASSVTYKAQ